MNVAVKKPPESVVTVIGVVVFVVPSYAMVIVDVGAKFAPSTLTEVPTKPEIGVRVIVGWLVLIPEGTTVKIALAESPAPSVAITV